MTNLTDRVYRFLNKQKKKKAWDFSDAPDERQAGKVEHKIEAIHHTLALGLLGNQPTLRDVEEMTHDKGLLLRSLVPKPISDTTLATEAQRLDPDYLRGKLVEQVRDMQRSKLLLPVGLPCGVATVDGKNLATLPHNAGGRAQRRTSNNAKWQDSKREKSGTPYHLMPVLRATLTSAESKPCIHQLELGPQQGESSLCQDMVQALHKAYGRSGMIDVLDFDAGFTSLANADFIDSLGYGYVFALKGDQPELFEEAQRLLCAQARSEAPEAETCWERRNGKRIRRRLWRTDEMLGITNTVGCWKHLRQSWLVRQETALSDGQVATEDRYFVTSLLWNYLSPAQILLLVRNHWGVENDTFNSLDLQWREDHGPWCSGGSAVWSLGLLRLMAYNIAQYLRRRRLRRKDADGRWLSPPSWRQVFRALRRAIERLTNETEAIAAG